MRTPPVSYARWVDALRARAKDVADPGHLAMIDCFIEHMVSERSGNIERFMRTMVEEPVYRSWGRVRPQDEPPSLRRGEQIRLLYQAMMDRADGFPEFELEMERFFVGDDAMAMDGVLHRLVRADELEDNGHARPEGTPDDAPFVVSARTALFISFVDGRMVGEDLYYDSTATVTGVG